jgi:hypothetical protein
MFTVDQLKTELNIALNERLGNKGKGLHFFEDKILKKVKKPIKSREKLFDDFYTAINKKDTNNTKTIYDQVISLLEILRAKKKIKLFPSKSIKALEKYEALMNLLVPEISSMGQQNNNNNNNNDNNKRF